MQQPGALLQQAASRGAVLAPAGGMLGGMGTRIAVAPLLDVACF